jgi:AcrR family transcriptional regulator
MLKRDMMQEPTIWQDSHIRQAEPMKPAPASIDASAALPDEAADTQAPLPRRSQDERSADTRSRLMQATLTVLNDSGYARAGVTRGALHHHFAGKDDLVAQSVVLMLDQATEQIERLALDVSQGRLTLDGFVDRIWEMFSGPLFMVTLEHVTEARHNAWLKAQLVQAVRQFHASLNAIWQRFFKARGVDPETATTALNATLCLMRGMGVQTVLRDDAAYYANLVAHWKRHLHGLLNRP